MFGYTCCFSLQRVLQTGYDPAVMAHRDRAFSGITAHPSVWSDVGPSRRLQENTWARTHESWC